MSGIEWSGKTDPGIKRSNNEDAFVVDTSLGLFAVADGMGGAASGEIASRIFVETTHEVFRTMVRSSQKDLAASIQTAFQQANENIINFVTEHMDHRGMGCTAEVISFNGDRYVLGHVGDSRTYLYRDGEMIQITKDHSLVQDQLDRGIITREEARRHALRHVIARAVGIDETLAVDIIRGSCTGGDVFLLCSDGLTEMVSDEDIQALLSLAIPVSQRVDRLIEKAKAAGGRDNITAVLCEITV